MKSFSDFLTKFKDIQPPDKLLRQGIAETIQKEIGVEIPIKKISIRNKIAFIQTSPSVKAILFIKKEDLLKKIHTTFNNEILEDIQ